MKLRSRKTRKVHKTKSKTKAKARRSSKTRKYYKRHRRNINRSGKSKNKTLGHRRYMRGGFGAGAGPQGIAWSASPANWPHQSNGVQVGSYLSLSKDGIPAGPVDPPKLSNGVTGEFPPKFSGGGGVSFTQDLTNLVRQGVDSVYNIASGFKGVQPPISSDVTVQPIAQSSPMFSSPSAPLDFKAIQNASAEAVKGLSD